MHRQSRLLEYLARGAYFVAHLLVSWDQGFCQDCCDFCLTLLQVQISCAAVECDRLMLELGAMVKQAQVIFPIATSLESECIECAMCSGGRMRVAYKLV